MAGMFRQTLWSSSMADSTTTPTKILRRHEVEARTGLSRSTIYSKMTPTKLRPQDFDPEFPKPVKIGVRAVGWLESEINQWLAVRVQKSRQS
jgi:prophage regulatory protein